MLRSVDFFVGSSQEASTPNIILLTTENLAIILQIILRQASKIITINKKVENSWDWVSDLEERSLEGAKLGTSCLGPW